MPAEAQSTNSTESEESIAPGKCVFFFLKKRLRWIDCLWTNRVWNFITIHTVIEIFQPGPKFCRDRLVDLWRHSERPNWKSGYISIKDSGSCESRRMWLIPCQKGNYCSGLRKVAEWHSAPPPSPFFFSWALSLVEGGTAGIHSWVKQHSSSHRFLAAISWDVNTTARQKVE